ncbi:hypothetical protein [Collinsella sp. LCP19S3_D5]|uniref:hypothetical protein n=1 Tax=Collinsella sp. LCP19S3_D5 TaxID=3438764 RepID=UPI003F934202
MDKLYEYWYCVSPQYNLPIYEGKGAKGALSSQYLIGFGERYSSQPAEKREDYVKGEIESNPAIIGELRKLVGVSDKRFYLDMTYEANMLGSKSSLAERRGFLKKHDTKYFIRLIQNDRTREAAVALVLSYFKARGLFETLDAFSTLTSGQYRQIISNLIDTKESQQADAKYRGHGAEMAFARVFHLCGVKMLPENKYVDPMASYDPNIDIETMKLTQHENGLSDSHSFDLVVLDEASQPAILVQSLIHSSDPGQYGVNKSNETVEIKKKLDDRNRRYGSNVKLLGSVDGVGFCENQNGTIAKMLEAFDGFFQINTLFKIPIYLAKYNLVSDFVGVSLDEDYFDEDFVDQFFSEYLEPSGLKLLREDELSELTCYRAGRGYIAFQR